MAASQIILEKAPSQRLYVCDHCGLNYRPIDSEGGTGIITTNSDLENEVFCPSCLDVLFASDKSYKFINKVYRPDIFPIIVNLKRFSYEAALHQILTIALLKIYTGSPKNIIYTASNGIKYALNSNKDAMDKLYFDQLKVENIFKDEMEGLDVFQVHKAFVSDISSNVRFLPKVDKLIDLIENKIYNIKEIADALNIAFEEE